MREAIDTDDEKSDKRRAFLTEIFDLCLRQNTSKDVTEKQEVFLKETTNGYSLYKYCAVRDKNGNIKSHIIDSIKDQTISCSDPSVFNDPFDCKLGITFKQVYEYKFKQELGFIDKITQEVCLAIERKIPLKKLSNSALNVYRKIYNSNTVRKAIGRAKEEDGQIEWDELSSKAVIEIINILIEDDQLNNNIQIVKSFLPRIMDNFQQNGRLVFDPSNTEIGFESFLKINGIEDVDEVDGTLRYYKQLFPENPEPALEIEKIINDYQNKVNKDISENARIASFGTSYTNRLMWSHYASNHTGICIEYDFSDCSDKCILPVCYSRTRPQVPINTDANTRILWALFTKDCVWEYEDEWRLVVKADSNKQKYSYVSVPITHIYLGTMISDTDKKEIMDAANINQIPVSQIWFDREKYQLHAKEASEVK